MQPHPCLCSLHGSVVGTLFEKHPWVSPSGLASGVGKKKAESYSSWGLWAGDHLHVVSGVSLKLLPDGAETNAGRE